jgi:hypothetical protein
MRTLLGASPRYGCDLDAPHREGIRLDLGDLQLAALLRHGLPLSAAGWMAWAQRYRVPLGTMPEVWRA